MLDKFKLSISVKQLDELDYKHLQFWAEFVTGRKTGWDRYRGVEVLAARSNIGAMIFFINQYYYQAKIMSGHATMMFRNPDLCDQLWGTSKEIMKREVK